MSNSPSLRRRSSTVLTHTTGHPSRLQTSSSAAVLHRYERRAIFDSHSTAFNVFTSQIWEECDGWAKLKLRRSHHEGQLKGFFGLVANRIRQPQTSNRKPATPNCKLPPLRRNFSEAFQVTAHSFTCGSLFPSLLAIQFNLTVYWQSRIPHYLPWEPLTVAASVATSRKGFRHNRAVPSSLTVATSP